MEPLAAIAAILAGPLISIFRRARRNRNKRRVYGLVVRPEDLPNVTAQLQALDGIRILPVIQRDGEGEVEMVTRIRNERDVAMNLWRNEKIVFLSSGRQHLVRVVRPERVLTFAGDVVQAIRAAQHDGHVFQAGDIDEVMRRVRRFVGLD